jgi:ABC-type multidrug transport system fused ATPase/permease subunit
MPALFRLSKYLKPYWPHVAVTTLAQLLSTLTSLAVPHLIRQAIDLGLTRGDAHLMAPIGAGGKL